MTYLTTKLTLTVMIFALSAGCLRASDDKGALLFFLLERNNVHIEKYSIADIQEHAVITKANDTQHCLATIKLGERGTKLGLIGWDGKTPECIKVTFQTAKGFFCYCINWLRLLGQHIKTSNAIRFIPGTFSVVEYQNNVLLEQQVCKTQIVLNTSEIVGMHDITCYFERSFKQACILYVPEFDESQCETKKVVTKDDLIDLLLMQIEDYEIQQQQKEITLNNTESMVSDTVSYATCAQSTSVHEVKNPIYIEWPQKACSYCCTKLMAAITYLKELINI